MPTINSIIVLFLKCKKKKRIFYTKLALKKLQLFVVPMNSIWIKKRTYQVTVEDKIKTFDKLPKTCIDLHQFCLIMCKHVMKEKTSNFIAFEMK